jgi:hypothetical protein
MVGMEKHVKSKTGISLQIPSKRDALVGGNLTLALYEPRLGRDIDSNSTGDVHYEQSFDSDIRKKARLNEMQCWDRTMSGSDYGSECGYSGGVSSAPA